MNGNGGDEAAGGQIASRDEQSLGEARRRPNADLIPPQPLDVEEEGNALVHVGEEEVEDEQQKLIRGVPLLLHRPRRRGEFATAPPVMGRHYWRLPIAVVVCLLVKYPVDAQGEVDGLLEGLWLFFL